MPCWHNAFHGTTLDNLCNIIYECQLKYAGEITFADFTTPVRAGHYTDLSLLTIPEPKNPLYTSYSAFFLKKKKIILNK